MNYDKKIYRQQYGRLYLNMLYWGLGLAFFFLQIGWYPLLFKWHIPLVWMELVTTLCLLSLFIGVGLGGYLYFDGKRMAKKQQQWIDKNKIYYRIEKRPSWFKSDSIHTITYHVRQLREMEITTRYIICIGDVHITDESNNKTVSGNQHSLKIPRTFKNQDMITNLNCPKKSFGN